MKEAPIILDRTDSIIRTSDCIGCGKCVNVCRHTQGVGALTKIGRGITSEIKFHPENCTGCGQCIKSCEVGALQVAPELDQVKEKLASKKFYSMLQVAPGVRVALAQHYKINNPEVVDGKKLMPGELAMGKLITAGQLLGFDEVPDTLWAADGVILEEGREAVTRILNYITKMEEKKAKKIDSPGRAEEISEEEKKVPEFTSCCSAWTELVEMYYPEFIPNLSSVKSPQQYLAADAKTRVARIAKLSPEVRARLGLDPEGIGLPPEKMYIAAAMPCTAKKREAKNTSLNSAAKFNNSETFYPDVDNVLGTVELIEMIDEAGIDFKNLPVGKQNSLLGEYTGSAAIFGRPGGVMLAALRYSAKVLGEELGEVEFKPINGDDGITSATLTLAGHELTFAIAHGGENVQNLLKMIKEGKIKAHFCEFMMCPNGCAEGGAQPPGVKKPQQSANAHQQGQPVDLGKMLDDIDVNRDKSISDVNKQLLFAYRTSYCKPDGTPDIGGHVAEQLFHRSYSDRSAERGQPKPVEYKIFDPADYVRN